MTSIDDIWDEPLAPASPPKQDRHDDNEDKDAPRRVSKRPLFFDSDSGDDTTTPVNDGIPKEIDELFKDLDTPDDGIQGLTAALDLDALRRAANAKQGVSSTPYDILPSSSPQKAEGRNTAGDNNEKEGVKKRKTIPRLDEGRLLGPDGFPALLKESKKFKIKGKGHEVSDLNRLLTVYQYWTHKLYPRSQFNDTIDRVENLCHSRRMHVALSVWYDESKGLIHGKQPEEIIEVDADTDEENSTTLASTASAEHSDPPSRPPSSTSERDNDEDLDIEAMIRADEERQQQTEASSTIQPGTKPKRANNDVFGDEFDVAMWEDFAFADDPLPPTASGLPPPDHSAEKLSTNVDDDMWDVTREGELRASTTVEAPMEMDVLKAPPSAPELPHSPMYPDDWEDMYA